MGAAGLAPGVGRGLEVTLVWEGDVLGAEGLHRSALVTYELAQPVAVLDGVVDAAAEEDEAVRGGGGALERRFGGPAEPDRDRACRLGHERGAVDAVKAPGEVDDGFGEEPAQQLDLFR